MLCCIACKDFNPVLTSFDAAPAGDAFSPNPGNKAPQGSFPVCPTTSAPYTTANPYYVCDSKGECGELQGPNTEQAMHATPAALHTEAPAGHTVRAGQASQDIR